MNNKKCHECKYWVRWNKTKFGLCKQFENGKMTKLVDITVAGGYANYDDIRFADIFGCVKWRQK